MSVILSLLWFSSVEVAYKDMHIRPISTTLTTIFFRVIFNKKIASGP